MPKNNEYFERTYHHRSFIKRYAHQTRVNVAIGLIGDISSGTKILDFGCGKGYFIDKLKGKYSCNIVGYDKYLETDSKLIHNTFDAVDEPNSYDYFTVFETLEHCLEDEQIRILTLAHQQLKTSGKVIISVPIEIGPISLLKNIFRYKTTLAKSPEFNIKNIIKCALYNPPKEFRKNQKYPGHFGWDHRDLEKVILKTNLFDIEKRKCSPFLIPSIWFNSQMFYKLSPISK